MNSKTLILLGTGLAVGLGIGWLVVSGPDLQLPGFAAVGEASGEAPGQDPAPVQGAPAPDFELDTLRGGRIRLSEFRGRPVILNFWATWCAPCRIEMPAIQDRFERHSPNLVVLAVNFDESREQVQAFVDELGLTFDVLLDPGGEVNGRLYRVRGYPTTFVLDREGVIRAVHIGIMTEEQLDGYLGEVGLRP